MRCWLWLLCLPVLALDNSIRIYEASGSPQSGRPYTVMMVFMQGEFPNGTFPKPRVDGVVPAAWQVDVKNRWPDGSALSAFVSFPVTLSANGNVKVDFVPDANACHLGSEATCQAAALDQSGMLNFLGGAWNAQIRGTANSISYTADAKTMIANGDWQYWLRGPVVTRVIVRDNGFQYDFGWQWDGSNWQAPANDAYKSIHPMFELSFYPGWSGVETGFRVENSWWQKLQNLKLKLEFLAGSPATAIYSKTNYDLEERAASSYYGWSGTEPGAIVVDRNLPYLVATRILPSYDLTIQLDSATLTTFLGQWPANVGTDDASRPDPRSCTTQNPCAYIKTDMPGTGDADSFGILPRYQLFYLYAMGDSRFTVATRKQAFDQFIVGSGDAAVTIGIHYRESVTGATPDTRNWLDWPNDQTTSAFGRIKSVTAHPDARSTQYDTSGAYPAQHICPSCPARTHSWLPDQAHWPSLFTLPYILTGRWTYLMSLQQSAAHWLMYDNPGWSRHYDWGIVYSSDQPRIAARILKETVWAAVLSPDSPERNYLISKLKNSDAAYEGVFHITDGLYQSQVQSDCRGAYIYSDSQTFNSSHGLSRPNGQRKVFALTGHVNSVHAVTSITLNGQAQTVGVYGQDTGRNWYWWPGRAVIVQDAAATPISSTDSLVVNYQYGYSANPWCLGQSAVQGVSNPLGLTGLGQLGVYGAVSAASGLSGWMVSYWAMHVGWARQMRALAVGSGYLFEKSGERFGRFYVDGALYPGAPILYLGSYQTPTGDDLGLMTTWDRFAAAHNPAVSLVADITAGATSFTINCQIGAVGCPSIPLSYEAMAKIDNELIRTCGYTYSGPNSVINVCSGGRGAWGTQAAAHTTSSSVSLAWRVLGGPLYGHTYPNLWVNALAMYDDVTGAYGSGLKAYTAAMGYGYGLESRAADQRYALVPRASFEPSNVRAVRNGAALTVYYNAPTLAACKVALDPATSDDSGDTSDGGGARSRSYTWPSVASGSHTVRVSCGNGRILHSVTVQ